MMLRIPHVTIATMFVIDQFANLFVITYSCDVEKCHAGACTHMHVCVFVIYYYYYYYYYYYSLIRAFYVTVSRWFFFTSALADGFSLESEWQKVSSSLQDSS